MSKRWCITMALVLCATGSVFAGTVTHYNIDFNAPSHASGSLPSTGNATNLISSVNMGLPVVSSSFGSLVHQPLVFNPNVGTYEQIGLNLGRGYDNYKISFDVETHGLVGSLYAFTILLDTPEVRTFSLHGSVGLYSFAPTSESGSRIGSFSDDQLMHIEIAVDILHSKWTISAGNYPPVTKPFVPSGNDIQAIRFSLSPWYGGAALDSTVFVAIDNISVTSDPAAGQTIPPVADAGSDRIEYDDVVFDASRSYDPDGTLVSYEWTIVPWSDPNQMIMETGLSFEMNDIPAGFYDVILTVTDNDGLQDTAESLLAVKGPAATYDPESRVIEIPELEADGQIYEVTLSRQGWSQCFSVKKGLNAFLKPGKKPKKK